MTTKKCNRCGETKPLSEFNTHRTYGHQHWCKACYAEYRRNKGPRMRDVTPTTQKGFVAYLKKSRAAYLEKHPEEAPPV